MGFTGRILASKAAHDGVAVFLHAALKVIVTMEVHDRRLQGDLQHDRDTRDTWTTPFESLLAWLASWIEKTEIESMTNVVSP